MYTLAECVIVNCLWLPHSAHVLVGPMFWYGVSRQAALLTVAVKILNAIEARIGYISTSKVLNTEGI